MTQDSMPVTVQILDKEYRIACVPDEQHGLMDCARMLDQRMREVRQNGRVIGADRIAVMAALNLLYDMMQQRDRRTVDVERLAMLQERLSAAVPSDDGDNPNAAREVPAKKAERSASFTTSAAAPTVGVDASDESV